jgi:hypothetical protein
MFSQHKTNTKPYAAIGAGRLVSTIWKRGNPQDGWRYRFNVFRMSHSSGRVSRLLRPADVLDLAKLCQVLAATLVDDGCISAAERQQLQDLATKLDAVTNKEL